MADESVEKLIIWMGIWRLGAVVCPLNIEINTAHIGELLDTIKPKLTLWDTELKGHKIAKFIDSYGGPLLNKEISSIDLLIKNRKKPVSCIIGGSKVSTKINVLINLIKSSDNLIIVGAMANNFVKFQNKNVGKSIVEVGIENIIEKINNLAVKSNCKLIIPIDCNTSNNIKGNSIYKSLDERNIFFKRIIVKFFKKK